MPPHKLSLPLDGFVPMHSNDIFGKRVIPVKKLCIRQILRKLEIHTLAAEDIQTKGVHLQTEKRN